MKAIKINALTQEITEIDIDGSLQSLYAAADCTIIECAGHFDNGDIIYVDEEGLMNEVEFGFQVAGFSNPQPFNGSGVIVGTGKNGNTIGCLSDLEAIKETVIFWDSRRCLWIRCNGVSTVLFDKLELYGDYE